MHALSCPTLCDPTDHSAPGSSVHGVLQAAIRSGLPFLPPGDLPYPGIEPMSPSSPILAGGLTTAQCESHHFLLLKPSRKKVQFPSSSSKTLNWLLLDLIPQLELCWTHNWDIQNHVLMDSSELPGEVGRDRYWMMTKPHISPPPNFPLSFLSYSL